MNLEKYKNIFLDRDGIINSIVKRGTIISSPRNMQEFNLRDDFIKFSNNFSNKNISFFVCTNQPDIKRKLLELDELKKMHSLIQKHLDIIEIAYCPHDDNDDCRCRKPKPGLINKLISEYNLKREECIIIGDSKKDILAGKNAKIDTCLLETDYNVETKCSKRIHSLQELKLYY